ncbi:MAG: hypothetical protein V7K40_23605 [Nostoc sp.]|uniref:hypothetical protein n=1 Tax=Nostoc sp. TaxID=1180 RepID=UPI002FF6C719
MRLGIGYILFPERLPEKDYFSVNETIISAMEVAIALITETKLRSLLGDSSRLDFVAHT